VTEERIAAQATPARRRSARPCPVCGRPATPEAHPFCSRRCADVDLNRWLSDAYAIPAEDGDVERGGDDER
jgi:endogenous inhibitor of DNA gyrase (YacG/DUF329 family)